MKQKILILVVGLFIFLFSSYICYQYRSSFNFVDEYDNIVAAQFMMQGKTLFKDIFHNRQLGPVYISVAIQQALHPINLYKLILYHRLFVLLVTVIFGMVFLWRFKLPALIAVFFVEIARYFFFGMMFQGESMIIYPVLYLAALTFGEESLGLVDLLLAGFFAFFTVFMRETYIPLVIFLLGYLLYRNWRSRLRFVSLEIFIILSGIILLTVPLQDYLYSLFYVNSHAGFESEFNPIVSLLYPLYIFIKGSWNYTKTVYSFISLAFISSGIYIQFPVVIIILALSVPRALLPGTELFGAYKLYVWFALLTYFSAYRLAKRKILVGMFLLLAALSAVMLPQAVFKQNVIQKNEFEIFFNRFETRGEILKSLANTQDTLFIDGYDSLLFATSGLPPSYKYILYYPVVEKIPLYTDERLRMFKESPPTFYYRDCLIKGFALPSFVSGEYGELVERGEHICLYVRKEKLSDLSEEQKNKLKDFHYEIASYEQD